MATRWNQGKWNDGSVWLSTAGVAGLGRKHIMGKIKLNILKMSIAAAIVYLKAIIGKMTGNAKFTACAAKTTALETAVTALETANTDYEESKATTDEKMAVRDNALAAVNAAAHSLASAAEGETTDAAELLSGGWELVADRAPVGLLHPPANFHATGGDLAGSVDLACDPQHGAQTQVAEWATNPAGPYTRAYTGKKTSCTIGGLVSGTEYWFRMAAIGAAGQSDWAGPISKRAT